MKSKNLIIGLVALQIFLISISFTVLWVIDNEAKFFPDYINIAGKNRYYTALLIHEIDELASGTTTINEIDESLEEFHSNILLLKNGGSFSGHIIEPLPLQFQEKIDSIEELFLKLKSFETELIILEQQRSSIERYNSQHEIIEDELFDASNQLTLDINNKYDQIHKEKENLKLILPIINGIVYVVTLAVILQSIKRESKQMTKLEKLYTIGQMASRLAHDLRNPITVIKANLDILQNQKPDEKIIQDRYKRMQCSILDMSHIIEDVLEFAREKELTLHKQSVLKIINDALSSINIPSDIKLDIPDEDVEINCDERKLQAVFVNIIVNAFDAMSNKGKITIRFEKGLRTVKILISDSGSGIPEDILTHIFEPLFTSKPTGTGLGLGIAKNIIEQHKGTISVSNNPTTFTISLPIH